MWQKCSTAMFDTEKFIAEIQKRPAIYDINSIPYNDRYAKLSAWEQVCEATISEWHCLSVKEKRLEEKIIRGKWRNIRDYFIKELRAQRSGKGRLTGRKRKRYMYFDQLLFLLPAIENNKQSVSKSNGDYFQCKSEESDTEPNDEVEEYEAPIIHAGTSQDWQDEVDEVEFKFAPDQFSKPDESRMNQIETEVLDINSPQNDQRSCGSFYDDDYDKMFLLSLLPILRRIPEDMKLDVRIQMEQVLATAMQSLPARNSKI